MGVAHHLPGLGLGGLAEVADVLPPTRLLLDPAGLRGGQEEEEEEEEGEEEDEEVEEQSHSHHTASDTVCRLQQVAQIR